MRPSVLYALFLLGGGFLALAAVFTGMVAAQIIHEQDQTRRLNGLIEDVEDSDLPIPLWPDDSEGHPRTAE